MAKKTKNTKKKVSEIQRLNNFTEKQRALIEKVFRKIDVTGFALQEDYIKLSSAILILQRLIYQLRLIECAPDDSIVANLIIQLNDAPAAEFGSSEGVKNGK